jgi:ribosome-binding protein aMBF1 (putative translation factor)
MRKPKTMTDVLRKAIANSGETRYRISQGTGIDQASLMRFARGDASLRLDRADALAAYLNLELVERKAK